MLTVGRLARRFGISRSTLLYYDSIGLLSPSRRSRAGYRLYAEADVRRMERIELYRRAGLPLADIARVLASGRRGLGPLLEKRLRTLGEEIRALRHQERLVLRLLRHRDALPSRATLDKDGWVAILRASGMGEPEMRRWHVEFERLAPEAHGEFLERLGVEADEVARIREWSRRLAGSSAADAM